MGSDNQKQILEETLTHLERNHYLLEKQRHELFQQRMLLLDRKISLVNTICDEVARFFYLTKFWFEKFFSDPDYKKSKYPRYQDQLFMAWNNNDDFRDTVLDYIGKIHDRDEEVFAYCNHLLVKLNGQENEINEVNERMKEIHHDFEVNQKEMMKVQDQVDALQGEGKPRFKR